MNNETFTLVLSLIGVLGGILFGSYAPWVIKVTKKELEYFASFDCNDKGRCGRGALCNSCYIRKWAIDKLRKYHGI